MNNYLLTYYDGTSPAFMYADTIDAARSCATTVANRYAVKRNHILSIVNIANDHVVFYAQGDSLSTRLSSFGRPAAASTKGFSFRALLGLFIQKGTMTVG